MQWESVVIVTSYFYCWTLFAKIKKLKIAFFSVLIIDFVIEHFVVEM